MTNPNVERMVNKFIDEITNDYTSQADVVLYRQRILAILEVDRENTLIQFKQGWSDYLDTLSPKTEDKK